MRKEYHQSTLKLYPRCPASFKMSMDGIKPAIPPNTQKLMDEGSLFEGYLFGFKEDKDETSLYGRRQPATIAKLKAQLKTQADYVRPLFMQPENSYVDLKYKADEYNFKGEADNIGVLNWKFLSDYTGQIFNNTGKSINDLKKTGDIKYGWGYQQKRTDLLQAIEYVYIHFKNTGEILPFVFIVIEDKYIKPIIKIKKVFIQDTDFEWFESFVDEIHNDLFYTACPGYESCEGGKGGSRCWFLEQCQAGRNYIGQTEIVEFGSLQ